MGFNVVNDPDLDCSGGRPKEKESIKFHNSICLNYDLIDILRTRNPDRKLFSWKQNNPLVQTRLDFWLISDVCQDEVEEMNFKTANLQDVEKFLRRVQLKAFFHDKEDDSNTSDKDIFGTLQTRKSKWTPPEGQFASLDFFIKKCRHDINKLNFNRNTKFSNLSSEERAALENLSKRKDLIVKAADKGGALVVWRADLYQKEALRQLSDTSFMLKSIKISLPLINKLSRAILTTL